MSFDAASLLLSLPITGSGLVLFIYIYGRKQQRWPHLVAGLLFMVFPYSASNAWAMVGVALALGAGLWWVVRLGW